MDDCQGTQAFINCKFGAPLKDRRVAAWNEPGGGSLRGTAMLRDHQFALSREAFGTRTEVVPS
jgi:hypothetical protein